MEFIHVRNLERYHPGYKDRAMQYAKIFINMADGDPETETLCEIDFARLIKIILLELRARKPLPNNDDYWTRKGFDIKKRSMSLTLQMLHNFLDSVTDNSSERNTEYSIGEKEKEEDKEEDKEGGLYRDFEGLVYKQWNDFCVQHPELHAIRSITAERRAKLKKRYLCDSFKDFAGILIAFENQRFLFGENDQKWVATFDWLIEKDLNHIKVLEGRYKNNNQKEIPEALRPFIKTENKGSN